MYRQHECESPFLFFKNRSNRCLCDKQSPWTHSSKKKNDFVPYLFCCCLSLHFQLFLFFIHSNFFCIPLILFRFNSIYNALKYMNVSGCSSAKWQCDDKCNFSYPKSLTKLQQKNMQANEGKGQRLYVNVCNYVKHVITFIQFEMVQRSARKIVTNWKWIHSNFRS